MVFVSAAVRLTAFRLAAEQIENQVHSGRKVFESLRAVVNHVIGTQ